MKHPQKEAISRKKGKKQELRILYSNPRGATGKICSIEADAQTYDPHYIALAETKFSNEPLPIKGYKWFYKNRKNREGGGVAIAARKDLLKSTTEVENLEDQNQEVLWVQLKSFHETTFVGVYYGKQETDKREEVQTEYSQLQTQVHKLEQIGEVILLGDHNAKLEINKGQIQQKQSRNGDYMKEFLEATHLYPASLEADHGNYTWVDRNETNKKSIIDYVCVSENLKPKIKSLIIHEEGILRAKSKFKDSDHNTITISLEIEKTKTKTKVSKWKKGTPQSWQSFNTDVENKLAANPGLNYQGYNKVVKNALHKNIGKRTITIGQKPKSKNERIIELTKERKETKKSFQEAQTGTQNKLVKLDEYMEAQRKLRSEHEKEQQEQTQKSLEKLITTGGSKSQNFWARKRSLLRNNNEEYDLVTEEGYVITDPEKAKNEIANYFENLYKAREGLEEYEPWNKHIIETVDKLSEMYGQGNHFEEITMGELKNAIKSLKPNKAVGPDGIPNEVYINAGQDHLEYLLKIFNTVTRDKEIPPQWKTGEIIRLYKGKGTKGKCSNERGITLASNVGKLYERIITTRMTDQLSISDAQAGGKKGRATTDHILVLKELISIAKLQKKPLYLPFLDVSKAYDKGHLPSMLYSADKNGLKGDTWHIMKVLNSKLNAVVRTKHGNTRTIYIDGVPRQGGPSSTPLYSGHIDDISRLATARGLGMTVNSRGDTIPIMEWVDDIVGAATDPKELQKILDVINEIANRYRIEFGQSKSKVLIIGGNDDTPKPNFKLGDMTLEYTDKYKYLGEMINSSNTLQDQIKEITGKTEAAYQTILTVAQDRVFKNIELDVIWRLVESCIQSIILYGCETWVPNKADYEKLNRIQESVIRRILMTPVSTPKEALYLETGLLDIEHMSYIRRINMYIRLKENPSELIDKVCLDTENNWFTQTEQIMSNFSIDHETLQNKQTRKRVINEKIAKSFKEKLFAATENKSKLDYLVSNQSDPKWCRKEYIKKLTRTQASIIFRARSRMLEAKANYKGYYKQNLKCRLCGLHEETQDHILFECNDNKLEAPNRITKAQIFEEDDLKSLKETSLQIKKVMDCIEPIQSKKAPPQQGGLANQSCA